MNVFLVELETGVRIRDWVDQALTCDSVLGCDEVTVDCAALAGVYTRTLDADMLAVTKVTQDGTELTEAVSAAAVATSLSSWYFTPATRELRVHLSSDTTTASSVVLIAVVLETLARGATVTKARSAGTALTWDGRVAGLPSITQSITPDELGAGAIATFGELAVDNEDARYQRLLGERVFAGLEARIYLGDDADAFSAFALWLKALMGEPVAAAERLTIPLLSIASRLSQPAITRTFQTTDYANMDPAITGFKIPKVLGTVYGAQAFRIASGRWKWSDVATTSVTTVRTADGTAVTVTGTDHALGEFTVDASYDTESRLYVDGRGVDLDYPGELISYAAQNLGAALAATDLDATALTALDSARAVKVGLQVRTSEEGTGSVAEVLDRIAQSAHVDYFVDRTNVLSARVRQRDQGNYVTNDDFEVDTTGWDGVDTTISRTTSYRFRGAASLQIVKAAAATTGYARVKNLNLTADTLYVCTCLAAVISGATTTARLSLTDSDGNEYFSADYTLSSTAWTRIVFTTAVPITNAVIFCDATTVDCDATVYTCATEGGDLRIYPQYGGADDVTIVVDDVEVVEAVVLDDTNAEVLESKPADPTLWRVRAGYQYDARLGTRRFVTSQDTTTQRLFKTAESREIPGQLVDATDAATVAAAALDYFMSGRTRIEVRLLDVAEPIQVGDDTALFLNTSRRPSTPGDNRLFRLCGLVEERPENAAPELRLAAEALYDPIFDQMTITAA